MMDQQTFEQTVRFVARIEQLEETIAEALALLEQGERLMAEEILREAYESGPND